MTMAKNQDGQPRQYEVWGDPEDVDTWRFVLSVTAPVVRYIRLSDEEPDTVPLKDWRTWVAESDPADAKWNLTDFASRAAERERLRVVPINRVLLRELGFVLLPGTPPMWGIPDKTGDPEQAWLISYAPESGNWYVRGWTVPEDLRPVDGLALRRWLDALGVPEDYMSGLPPRALRRYVVACADSNGVPTFTGAVLNATDGEARLDKADALLLESVLDRGFEGPFLIYMAAQGPAEAVAAKLPWDDYPVIEFPD